MTNQGCGVVLLVPHPDGRAVLTADGRLPRTVVEGDYTVTACRDAIRTRLGVEPPVLRISAARMADAGEPGLVVVTLETIGPDAPPGLAWTGTHELADERRDPVAVGEAPTDPPEVARLVRGWLARLEHGPTRLDPPWTRPGWFDRVSAWMVDRMAARGTPAIEMPRIVHLWGIAIVLRAETATTPMYLKASTPSFDREAAVTALLARESPDLVTGVAAVEVDEGWLLMDDHGGRGLGADPPETWAAGLETMARLQRTWTGRTAALLRAGAQDRPLRGLVAALPTMHETPALADQLTPDELAAWCASIPAFVAACERLDALGPAPTLLHGDLHPWNVAVRPQGPLIFDWTDAAVGHPFCDLGMYVTRAAGGPTRRALRDAYLACWTDALEPAALVEAGDLAIVVSTLYQVQSYIALVASLDPDDIWDLGVAAGSWARSAIATLDEGIDVRRPGHADG